MNFLKCFIILTFVSTACSFSIIGRIADAFTHIKDVEKVSNAGKLRSASHSQKNVASHSKDPPDLPDLPDGINDASHGHKNAPSHGASHASDGGLKNVSDGFIPSQIKCKYNLDAIVFSSFLSAH